MKHYIAVDVGGTSIKYALMDEDANLLEQGEIPTSKTGLDDFVDQIVWIANQWKTKPVEALVMSAPGRIDEKSGYFYTGGALDYLHETDVRSLLEERLHMPVSVENDAKAAALAELWKGVLRNRNSGLVITLGTGIGGAVVIDGNVWHGFTHAAGELSGIPVHWNTRATSTMPTWTTQNCVRALLERYAVRKGLPADTMNGRLFFEALELGDPEAEEELQWFCETLATGLFALQYVLDVEIVAVGGGISRQPAMIAALRNALESVYARMPVYCPASMPQVEACAFSNDANLIGALYHYKTRQKQQEEL
ncbi:ROK family protein [uncultured Dubosiella sp.]|uniref:ROK family protein n=1 Tax=uncultured Dubosiella sp. TaxID=1937011 RepID=UPI002598C96E|nr:ROK family protein [uncultured Dubosiella sp.]